MDIQETVTIDCDAALVQAGFYPEERAPGGQPFRWIGPEPVAVIFLPPLEAPVEVSLRVHSAFLPEVLEEVRLALDGGAWVPAVLRRDATGLWLSACLPPGPVAHLGALRLDIDTHRTASPRERGEMDTRHLSLALSSVTVARLPG